MERISTFEYISFEGSKATPGFPGFVMVLWVYVQYVCVCTLRMSQSILVVSRPATCRVDLLVWNGMGRIVCLDTADHSLTSAYFPFIYWLIICCRRHRWLILWKRCALCQTVASFVNVSAALIQDMVCWNVNSPVISVTRTIHHRQWWHVKPLVPGK